MNASSNRRSAPATIADPAARTAWEDAYAESYAERFSEAVRTATTAERARLRAIMTSPAAKDRRDMARHLAVETDLPADLAIGVLAASPAESADGRTGIAQLDRLLAATAAVAPVDDTEGYQRGRAIALRAKGKQG